MIGQLPESLTVNGKDYPIRSDYRDVLAVIEAQADDELTDTERMVVTIYMLYADFGCASDVLNSDIDLEEAYMQAVWFMNCGQDDVDDPQGKPTYDWNKDEQMIFSSVNKVAGKEIRAEAYLHYWTFMGYFNEIQDDLFVTVVSIRDKRNKGKKLDKWEKEFIQNNPKLFDIQTDSMAKKLTEQLRARQK